MPSASILPQAFYARDSLVVAEALLGMHLHRDGVVLRITEVEAYRHPNDSASHCRMGRTPRNAPMWGPPGHTYVYLCYGMHHLLNLVTGEEGEGAAVLIRACEPVRGLRKLLERRGATAIRPALLTGPGKIGEALGLDARASGHCLFRAGGLTVREGARPNAIVRGPRVGIGYATPEDQLAPWRLAIAGSEWVTARAGLQPGTAR